MAFDAIVEQAAERLPVSAMVRSLLENCLNDAFVDGIFAEHRRLQYERNLLFSTIVGLLSVVVCKVYPSIHAVIAAKERLGVSITALYNKLNGTDPEVSAALLKVSAGRMAELIDGFGPYLLPRSSVIERSSFVHLLQYNCRPVLTRFRKTGRGPKKPQPKRSLYGTSPHVSTARLLKQEK